MIDMDCITGISDAEIGPGSHRQLKVGYAHSYPGRVRLPTITMTGQWLEEYGFNTGTKVEVRVMPDCIVLIAREPELMQALRKVGKMSARKQKQVNEFIGVISGKTKAE